MALNLKISPFEILRQFQIATACTKKLVFNRLKLQSAKKSIIFTGWPCVHESLWLPDLILQRHRIPATEPQ